MLLREAERATWRIILKCGHLSPPWEPQASRANLENLDKSSHSKALRDVQERAAQMQKWTEESANSQPLDFALNHLTLGRAALYAAILNPLNFGVLPADVSHIDDALDGLRQSRQQFLLVQGLLTRALLRFLEGARTGSESALVDLDEAWEIAERGPMRLFMADIHLYRARLLRSVKPYPWTSSQEDLKAARKLIEQCGYWRRKEELEDAEEAAKNW